jgi:DNA polymerase I
VIPSELPFEEIWLRDFEFVPQPGERPDVVCLAAYELRSGRTLRLWRDKHYGPVNEIGDQPPYRTDSKVLFVDFVTNAESACHLSLNWPLSARVLDLNPAFRNLTNGRYTPAGKGLLGALRYFGLDTIATAQKDAMQKRVMAGWPFTAEERQRIMDYCVSDVGALRRLLPKIMAEPDFNLGVYRPAAGKSACRSVHRDAPSRPNRRRTRRGTARHEIKRRALQQLEAAGLITIERPAKKTPVVTLMPWTVHDR